MDSENQELKALMNVNWTRPRVPLVVLSCVASEETPSLSCAQVVELLKITQLNRPWQVNISSTSLIIKDLGAAQMFIVY